MDYNASEVQNAYFSMGPFGGFGSFALTVLSIVGLWKVFEKAGKPGWAAIIPFYNLIIILEIIGKPPIWILWILIPCTFPIFYVWSLNLLAKSFGKSVGFTVGLIFLPFIFFPLLGLTDARYLGPSAKEAQGFGPNNPFGNNPFNQPPTPPEA